MRVTRILHHSVNVEGHLDDTTAFYGDLLGLPTESRPMIPGIAGAWFAAGRAQIHLVDADPGTAPIRPTDAHVCLGVEDLDTAIDELERRGIAYERAAQGTVVQIWIADPAGNIIELQQDPDLAPPPAG